MATSGKGGGARHTRTRHQAVLAFPAWRRKTGGTDVYFSFRWDNDEQIDDHFFTPKNVDCWWATAEWEWIFVQEVPFDLTRQEFIWSPNAKAPPSGKTLKNKLYWKWYRFHNKKNSKR